ncbi:unnamed protein product [Didymodactylos carnosus]|uniref:NAD(P)(+)--arginine ADP-ribosyltransferase n=1 Tax=Didymodactylos carnosus TaxID=1234261 RepID=A0A814VT30_9BILA|nr:unnamed protein product [Didymodactylos carnosus]CAF3956389.1 unnamed protein product [Didymodactylos carnosus]
MPVISNSSNLENVIMVWLDEKLDKTDDNHKLNADLQSIFESVETFNNMNECISFIANVKDERIFLVVSDSLGQQILPLIYQLAQLESIYVVCSNKAEHEKWVLQYKKKVKGVFNEADSIFEQLRQDSQEYSKNLLTMTGISSKCGSDSNLNKQEAAFMYSLLLRDVLIGMEHGDDAKRDMVEFCREQYKDDKMQRQVVDEFDREYDRDQSVWWYTRECFLYKMMNKALRSQDIDVLYKLRFFIKHLHNQLAELHSQSNNQPMVLYRGQAMSSEQLNQNLKENVGGLLSVSEFLSTTDDKSVALSFASQNLNRAQIAAVFFEIEIDPTIKPNPFANIQQQSFFKTESEILFSMGSVFRIKSMVQASSGMWNVTLQFTGVEDQQLRTLRDYITRQIRERDDLYTLGKLMIEMGEWERAKTFYRLILKEISAGKNLHYIAPIYNSLAKSCMEKGAYRKAWKYYAKALMIKRAIIPPDDTQIAKILNNIGLIEKYQGHYSEALKTYNKVLEIFLRTLPPNHRYLAVAYNNIGLVHQDQGDYPEALKMYNMAHEIYSSSLSPSDPDLAVTYSNIGFALQAQGDHSAALEMFAKSLEIDLSCLPPNHPDLARTYRNIGFGRKAQGDYSEALNMYNKAHEIYLSSRPPKHPDLIATYNEIGGVHKARGDYSKAIIMFEKTLGILNSSLPPNYLDCAKAYNNFGEVRQAQGDYGEALKMYNKALDNFLYSLPSNHPDMAMVYNNIGLVHYELGAYTQALEMYEKTRQILFTILPSDHLDLGMVYNNFGEVHHAQGDYATALEMYNKAHEIYSASVPPTHPDLGMVHNNFGKLHQAQGDYAVALKMYNKAHEIYSASLPPNHCYLATTYNNMGSVFKAQGEFLQALEVLKKAHEIYSASVPPTHPDLAKVYNNFGEIYQAQGDYSEALKVLKMAHEIYSTSLPSNHPNIVTVHNNIVAALSDQTKSAEARDEYSSCIIL